MARAAGDHTCCIRHRGRAGVAHSTIHTADCARGGNFLLVAPLVAAGNPPYFGLCFISGGAALARFALVEESISRNRFHSLNGLDLVRAAEPFRMDVPSAR